MSEDKADAEGRRKCWNCIYQQAMTGDTFLGKCTWFTRNNKGQDKEIPPEVVDSGCKHFIDRR